jgi:biopolymer transport protein TolR
MAIGTSGSGRQALTEINVTPLVDVMLVLLIVFMVTAPLIQQGVEVKLPEAKAEPVNAEEEKLVLSVKEDRSIWLGTNDKPARLALEELEEKLRANARIARDHELYLMADRALPYGFVVEVMAAVQRAGVTNLGMITNPAQAKADAAETRQRAAARTEQRENGR